MAGGVVLPGLALKKTSKPSVEDEALLRLAKRFLEGNVKVRQTRYHKGLWFNI